MARLRVTSMVSAGAYRAALEKMIADAQPNLFVTLVFNRSATLGGARANLREFLARLSRATVGPKWRKRPGECAQCIAIIENAETNLHLHLSVCVSALHLAAFKSLVSTIWAELEPAGSVDVQDVWDARGLANYMTKQITPEKCDLLLL